VRALVDEMKRNIENAYKGIPPRVGSSLPDFMTPEYTLRVLKAMYQATKIVAYHKIEDLRKQGIAPSPYDARFIKATEEMETESEAAK
jgi:hypothetical protein